MTLTFKEYLAKPRSFQIQWERMIEVIARTRGDRVPLHRAAREVGIRTETVVQLAGPALKKLPGGRYIVRPTDTLLRILLLPSNKGLREVAFRDSREASIVGEYWSAVERFIRVGSTWALRHLPRKWVIDENGRRIQLLTDLAELRKQGDAGEFHFESIYGRRA